MQNPGKAGLAKLRPYTRRGSNRLGDSMKFLIIAFGIGLTALLFGSDASASDFVPAPLAHSTQANENLNPIKRPPPPYPEKAMARNQTGWVLMDFDVEPDGTTSNVRVEDAEPPGVFDVASIRA
ncbi:MAG: hypothetical protein EP347_05210, partial [Alphaproteobacteria bacterium]